MVGCYGQATSSSPPINIELDNELEEARWFTRESVLAVLSHPKGTIIRRDEHDKFTPKDAAPAPAPAQGTDAAEGGNPTATVDAQSDIDTSSALAPSEGPVTVTSPPASQSTTKHAAFRVPPSTAIAGQLIKLWAEGGLLATEAGGLRAGRL